MGIIMKRLGTSTHRGRILISRKTKFVWVLLEVHLFLTLSVQAAAHYVDRNNTSPASPYLTWGTAATNIQDAVDVAAAGDTVLVTNGVYDAGGAVTPGYACMNRVVITKNITVQSVNGPDSTFIVGEGPRGNNAVRGICMSKGRLTGFTVTNGYTMAQNGLNAYDSSGGGIYMSGGGGVVSDCNLTGNSAYTGGGIHIVDGGAISNSVLEGNNASFEGGGSFGGTLDNCIIVHNTATHGGGSYASTLNNCTLSGNVASTHGGGVSGCFLYNCILTGNTAGNAGGGGGWSTLNNCALTGNVADNGGGSIAGYLNNCTLTGNLAYDRGGGCYLGTLKNCIIYFNEAYAPGDNWSDLSSASYCCTFPDPGGAGNITNNPLFVSSYHIATNSPCRGAGNTAYSAGSDIDNDAWLNPPSIGCDEPYALTNQDLNVAVEAIYTNVVVNHVLSFSANVSGQATSNQWMFGDGLSLPNTLYVSHAWLAPGDYNVVFAAYNDGYPNGVSVTTVVHVVAQSDVYVDEDSDYSVPPFADWTTAATNIQDAVDAASGTVGSTVWITNGTYNSGSRVSPLDTSLSRIVITNDIIVQSVNGPDYTFIEGNVTGAIRGVYMSAGTLSGFTIRNGYSPESGGGVNMASGNGTVRNCTISNNSTAKSGGGCIGGTLENCIVQNNIADLGGACRSAILTNCTLSGNGARWGGGSYECTLNRCVIAGNYASLRGGGNSYGTLNNCLLFDNAVYNSKVGTLSGSGGGSYGGTFNNCTIVGNGVYISSESTVTSGAGGGASGGILYNSIVYYNSASASANCEDGTTSYSCTTPDPGGAGNISAAPQFVDAAAGDWHLLPSSPCANAGANAYAIGSTDLDGNARISGSSIDMGAYEMPPPPAPEGFTAVNGDSQVSLYWQAANYATNYWVKGSLVSGGPYLSSFYSDTTNLVRTGLINGMDYYYVVSASGPGGNSPDSEEVHAVPSADPVPAEYHIYDYAVDGGSNVAITVSNSVPGHVYFLQKTDDLLLPVWTTMVVLPGNGSDVLFDIPVEPDSTKCYFKLDVQRQ